MRTGRGGVLLTGVFVPQETSHNVPTASSKSGRLAVRFCTFWAVCLSVSDNLQFFLKTRLEVIPSHAHCEDLLRDSSRS